MTGLTSAEILEKFRKLVVSVSCQARYLKALANEAWVVHEHSCICV